MKKLLLDTNFLLLPFERRLDVFGALERLLQEPVKFFVLKECLDEARQSRFFSSAESLLKANRVAVVSAGNGKPDDLVARWAAAEKAVVCTNDAALRRRLKKLGIQVISLRGESRLDFAN